MRNPHPSLPAGRPASLSMKWRGESYRKPKVKRNKLKSILGARILRKESTPSEVLLWKFLSNKGMCGYKFRRQHPIKGFVLDFYCPERKLAIEIDGKMHDNQIEHDKARQEILESIGIEFLRFRNTDVIYDIDMVLRKIKRNLTSLDQNSNKNEGSLLHLVERGRKG